MKESVIAGLSADYLMGYFTRRTSILRIYQNKLLEKYGRLFSGKVLEIGSEPRIVTKQYFPSVSDFMQSNVDLELAEHFVDVTNMDGIADASLDGVVCASVLEHVIDVVKAAAELQRVLKPGGKLLIMIPFAFPYHTEGDYWRLSKTAYRDLFKEMGEVELISLGGVYSTTACVFQRPAGVLTLRFLLHKTVGFLFAVLAYFDRVDGFPAGYGFYGVKR